MLQHDFNREPEFEQERTKGLLRIVRGFDVAGVSDGRVTERTTHIYSPDAGILTVDGTEYLIPPRSVSIVSPGAQHSVTQQDPLHQGYVFETHGSPDTHGYGSGVDDAEDNTLIVKGNGVTIYPDDSRILPSNVSKKSGWFMHAHKMSAFGISDAVWDAVRDIEVLHAHRVVEEGYITLDGVAFIQVGEDEIPVRPGQLLVVQPEVDLGYLEKHRVNRIALDEGSGQYWHVCYNTPSIPNNPAERVIFDAAAGFQVD